MEKLQMASCAIGDIESLLQASGINGEDEDGATSFDEKIRQLVIAALAGKNIEAATLQEEQSIADAKNALEREEENINAMLGGLYFGFYQKQKLKIMHRLLTIYAFPKSQHFWVYQKLLIGYHHPRSGYQMFTIPRLLYNNTWAEMLRPYL